MKPSLTRRAGPSAAAASLLCGLVAALLLLQTLGAVHAIVHHTAKGLSLRRDAAAALAPAERRAVGSRQAAAIPVAAAVGRSKPSSGWVDALFAGHDAGSSACALYDQLVQPAPPVDTTCHANPAFASPLPAEPPRVGRLAPQAVGFLARGPPPAALARSA